MATNLSPQHCTGLLALLPDEIDRLCDLVIDDVKRNVQYDAQQRRARAPTDFNAVTEKFNEKFAGTSDSDSSQRRPMWTSGDLKCAFVKEGIGRRCQDLVGLAPGELEEIINPPENIAITYLNSDSRRWMNAMLEECGKREALEWEKEARVRRNG